MLKPTVSVGECSIHIEERGILLMTLPHRMWESTLNESGQVGWSGRNRGESTVQSLVRFIEGKVRGCQSRAELFDSLDEILRELRNPVWNQVGKKKEKKNTSGTTAGRPSDWDATTEDREGVEELRWAA
jgi:hypothetical protein